MVEPSNQIDKEWNPSFDPKFNNRPIKVKVPLHINLSRIINENTTLLWKDFIYLLKTLYREDIDAHRK